MNMEEPRTKYPRIDKEWHEAVQKRRRVNTKRHDKRTLPIGDDCCNVCNCGVVLRKVIENNKRDYKMYCNVCKCNIHPTSFYELKSGYTGFQLMWFHMSTRCHRREDYCHCGAMDEQVPNHFLDHISVKKGRKHILRKKYPSGEIEEVEVKETFKLKEWWDESSDSDGGDNNDCEGKEGESDDNDSEKKEDK